jgi:hypothetical protein
MQHATLRRSCVPKHMLQRPWSGKRRKDWPKRHIRLSRKYERLGKCVVPHPRGVERQVVHRVEAQAITPEGAQQHSACFLYVVHHLLLPERVTLAPLCVSAPLVVDATCTPCMPCLIWRSNSRLNSPAPGTDRSDCMLDDAARGANLRAAGTCMSGLMLSAMHGLDTSDASTINTPLDWISQEHTQLEDTKNMWSTWHAGVGDPGKLA